MAGVSVGTIIPPEVPGKDLRDLQKAMFTINSTIIMNMTQIALVIAEEMVVVTKRTIALIEMNHPTLMVGIIMMIASLMNIGTTTETGINATITIVCNREIITRELLMKTLIVTVTVAMTNHGDSSNNNRHSVNLIVLIVMILKTPLRTRNAHGMTTITVPRPNQILMIITPTILITGNNFTPNHLNHGWLKIVGAVLPVVVSGDSSSHQLKKASPIMTNRREGGGAIESRVAVVSLVTMGLVNNTLRKEGKQDNQQE
mmetsp:Transcript_37741/g.46119  ORF Transcript_37741/g.46119 Transcript_37741/m.46119 type:complete len:258 (+) Transcript_37741:531-1304(+)